MIEQTNLTPSQIRDNKLKDKFKFALPKIKQQKKVRKDYNKFQK